MHAFQERGEEKREERTSLPNGQLPKSCESLLNRPTADQPRPNHLPPRARLSPTWNSRSPGWPFPPQSLPHLAISLVHLIFEPFSHCHRFSVGQTLAMPHVQNSQWNSPKWTRSFCEILPSDDELRGHPSPIYPSWSAVYGQILSIFKSELYNRRDRAGNEERTERKMLVDRVKLDVARF